MSEPARGVFTRRGVELGVRMAAPLLPGVIVFGMSVGTVAQKAGLSLAEVMLMSALVFAGASQMVALAAWQSDWTLLGAATVVALVFTVNARMILMGAALHPWMGHFPARRAYPILAATTDTSWIVAHRAEIETGRRDLGVLVGCAASLWTFWVLSAAPGWWLGAVIADPKRYALDLVVLAFFALYFVPLWKGARQARPWGVAAAVALVAYWLAPGQAYIVAGAVAGAFAGALLDD
jgi:4-azaleucine resistance transporter AzlC